MATSSSRKKALKKATELETKTPIMPQGTAVWLIEKTSLTFDQIAEFCGLHVLEVQALADEQVSAGMIGVDPVNLGQLTWKEIERCSNDPKARLTIADAGISALKSKPKRKYTSLLLRRDRPDAIAWLIKYYPEISDATICSLLSTTKNTVIAIREKTHAKMNDIRPRDPVLLGFCSQIEFDAAISELKSNHQEHSNE